MPCNAHAVAKKVNQLLTEHAVLGVHEIEIAATLIEQSPIANYSNRTFNGIYKLHGCYISCYMQLIQSLSINDIIKSMSLSEMPVFIN